MFVLLSRSAGNGRVCYVCRFGVSSQVTVGCAMFARVREKLDAQLPNATYVCSTLYVGLLLYVLARWRICADAHLDTFIYIYVLFCCFVFDIENIIYIYI